MGRYENRFKERLEPPTMNKPDEKWIHTEDFGGSIDDSGWPPATEAFSWVVELPFAPKAKSLGLALVFLAKVAKTLVEKERGYGDISDHCNIFSPGTTPEMRICTRLDEKLTRLKNLGGKITSLNDVEDTLMDIVGYIALLRGVQELGKDA